MGMLKSFLAMAGSPVAMRRINAFFTLFWLVVAPVALLLGWTESVTFVSILSLWALIASHASAWESARVEVAQQKADEKDVPAEVVNRIVEETEISSTTTTETETSRGQPDA